MKPGDARSGKYPSHRPRTEWSTRLVHDPGMPYKNLMVIALFAVYVFVVILGIPNIGPKN